MANFADKSAGKNAVGTFGAYVPRIFTDNDRNPTVYDWQGYNLLDEWLNRANDSWWKLVSLDGNATSKGPQALWVQVGAGEVLSTTGNDGIVVGPDVNGNINIIGDGTYLYVTGNAGTNTETISLLNGGDFATSFLTDNGTAVPALNVITFNAISQAGSSVSFSGATSIVRLNTTDALGNTNIGSGAGNATLTSTNCTLLGKNAGHALTSSPNNTIVGSLSGALLAGGTGANTIVGELSAANLLTGSGNIILGKDAGSALVGGESNNVIVGHAGISANSGTVVMAIPNGQTFFIWDGFDELYVGIGSGNVGTQAVNNCVFGSGSLRSVTTASENVLFGNNIMTTATTTGAGNVIFGSAAFTTGTGANNCLFGGLSLAQATTAGSNTTLGNATGYDAGSGLGLLTGTGNILIGYTAGSAYRGAESNNITIGTSAVVGENLTTRIGGFLGGENLQTKCFIQGIRGKTTVNADAIAVLIDSAGQLGTVSSSARYKENIEPMASYSHVLKHLRPVVFNYKSHGPEAKSVGLIAEEVATFAPQLVVYDADGLPETVKYLDLIPMLLNEVQHLQKKVFNNGLLVDELTKRIQLLESR